MVYTSFIAEPNIIGADDMRLVRGPDSWAVEYLGVGARRRKKFFECEGDARDWLAQHTAAAPLYGVQGRRGATLGDVLASYYDEVLSKNRAALTDAYRVDLIRLAPIAGLAPQKITPADVGAYCAERAAFVSAATLHNEMRILRRALVYAERHLGYRMPPNAVMGVTLPKRKPKRTRKLGDDEAARLVHELKRSPVAQSAVQFAMATGMSRSALRDLKWKDIDHSSATATLTFAPVGAPRFVSLSEAAMAIDAAFAQLRREGYVQRRRNVAARTDLLFPDGKANVRGQWGAKLGEWFVGHLKEMGIVGAKLGMHSFRHNHQGALRSAGVSGSAEALAVTGRKSAGSQGIYGPIDPTGRGFPIANLKKVLDQVAYPELDLSHLRKDP